MMCREMLVEVNSDSTCSFDEDIRCLECGIIDEFRRFTDERSR